MVPRWLGATGARAAALPLLSFNLGVEMAQVAIAVLVLPLIWNLQRRPAFALKQAPALSRLITLAGGYWFLVRMLSDRPGLQIQLSEDQPHRELNIPGSATAHKRIADTHIWRNCNRKKTGASSGHRIYR